MRGTSSSRGKTVTWNISLNQQIAWNRFPMASHHHCGRCLHVIVCRHSSTSFTGGPTDRRRVGWVRQLDRRDARCLVPGDGQHHVIAPSSYSSARSRTRSSRSSRSSSSRASDAPPHIGSFAFCSVRFSQKLRVRITHLISSDLISTDIISSVYLCVFCVFFYTAYMLCYCQHSGVDLMGLKPGP